MNKPLSERRADLKTTPFFTGIFMPVAQYVVLLAAAVYSVSALFGYQSVAISFLVSVGWTFVAAPTIAFLILATMGDETK